MLSVRGKNSDCIQDQPKKRKMGRRIIIFCGFFTLIAISTFKFLLRVKSPNNIHNFDYDKN